MPKIVLKLYKNAEGKISTIEIPRLRAKATVKDNVGTVEYTGKIEDIPLITNILAPGLSALLEDFDSSTEKLLTHGTRVESVANITDGRATLYTVPIGRAFYILFYDLNIEQTAAGLIEGSLNYTPDAVTYYDFCYLRGDEAGNVYSLHESKSFTFMRLPYPYSITVWAGAVTRSDGAMVGVEVDANI